MLGMVRMKRKENRSGYIYCARADISRYLRRDIYGLIAIFYISGWSKVVCRRVKGQIVLPMDLMYCCTTSHVSVSPLTSCGGGSCIPASLVRSVKAMKYIFLVYPS